ncbi:MAG TPA: 5-formyltetrahydrofolate cyclo-ligase [Candidatus Binataceae bacterium]|jgi:5-formyltetrahydrofolate cyclo-ligase
MADEKKYLREILTEARNCLSPNQVDSWSSAICSRILASPDYQRSRRVVLYASVSKEVRADSILDDALRSGRLVFFPKVEAKHLVLIRVRAASELKPGRFGINEPSGGQTVPAPELDDAVVCVPGLAFSPSGQRLGRGSGYYDRLLSTISPQAALLGLAYSFQLIDRLPESDGDRRVHQVFTQSAVHAAPNRAVWIREPHAKQSKEVHPRVSFDGTSGAGDRRNRDADREPASESK